MQCKLHTFLVIRSVENLFKIIFRASAASPDILAIYDAVSDVVESGVHWRSNFQIGSRVLKNCYKPILMHIYGTQCDFMHRSC